MFLFCLCFFTSTSNALFSSYILLFVLYDKKLIDVIDQLEVKINLNLKTIHASKNDSFESFLIIIKILLLNLQQSKYCDT